MAAVYKSLAKEQAKERSPRDESEKAQNRQRVLMLSSRGVTYRQRHLLADLYALLPHARKDAKLDTKTHLHQLNELAELYNCNNIVFFEARKGKDLYIWLSKPPNGPTVKMHCQNIHTMEELNFPGNCLKGSRPILSFDASFDQKAHTRLIKELLTHTFSVPPRSRKTKPFVDHVVGFTLSGNQIWIRCYQIHETELAKKPTSNPDGPAAAAEASRSTGPASRDTDLSLIEIGPRLVLTPIVILEGSFGGPVLFENREFVSPNQVRSNLRNAKASRYNQRAEATLERKIKKGNMGLRTGEADDGNRPVDELDARLVFA